MQGAPQPLPLALWGVVGHCFCRLQRRAESILRMLAAPAHHAGCTAAAQRRWARRSQQRLRLGSGQSTCCERAGKASGAYSPYMPVNWSAHVKRCALVTSGRRQAGVWAAGQGPRGLAGLVPLAASCLPRGWACRMCNCALCRRGRQKRSCNKKRAPWRQRVLGTQVGLDRSGRGLSTTLNSSCPGTGEGTWV